MNRFKLSALLGLFYILSGCVASETDVRVNADETVDADVSVQVSRQLFDMMALGGPDAQNLCPKHGKRVIGGQTVTCDFAEKTTLGKALQEVEKAKTQDPFLEDIRLERVDDERIRVVLPLDFEQIGHRPPQLSSENPAFETMMTGLIGQDLVFRLHALEIEDTNGTIKNDGKTVEFIIPVAEILSPTGNMPDEYTAVLKYRSCGFLGFGCGKAK